jgi:exopolysaccharide biosynthesis polyprenyl glycosylphosphotransferase
MLKEKEVVVRKAMILFDAFIVFLAFFLSYFLRQHFHEFYKLNLIPSTQVVDVTVASISEYLVVLFFVGPLWCAMLYLNGMYRSLRTRKLGEIVWIIIKSSFFTSLVLGTIIFLFKLQFVSRMFFTIFIMITLIFILLEKIAVFSIMHYVRKQGYNFRRFLVVGTGKRAADIINKIKSHPEWGIRIFGVLDDEPGRGIENVKDVEVIGNLKDISKILHSHAIDEVIFVIPRLRLNHIESAIYACETEGVKATIAVDLFDLDTATSRQTELDGIPLLTFETTVAKEWQLFIKRGMDLVISGLAIFILSPIFLIIAALIKLTSLGPVLFKQIRVGLNGREFVFLKFRTMYKGAEKKQRELEALNEMEGPVFKIKRDPRITPVGWFLRKFSIDELPQLFNVFIGHMSLIGPRPPIPKEVAQYKSWQRRRLSMRPGITCLWQISGRNKIGFNEWMELDLKYLDNWSLWSDFKILIKTIPVVLFGIGAY